MGLTVDRGLTVAESKVHNGVIDFSRSLLETMSKADRTLEDATGRDETGRSCRVLAL